MATDQQSLTQSSAGIRLIALMTIFNRGDFQRLQAYILENFHDSALAEIPASTRLAELKAIYRLRGKLRVAQVIGAGKHQVVVALATERGGRLVAQMAVEEAYPHRIVSSQFSVLSQSQE